jgi:hypothetical protein
VNGHQRDERDDFELLFRLEPPFRFLGTFAPFFLASLRPMAIACFRLFTFRPDPLFNVPFFRRRIADSTRFEADFPYRAIESPPQESCASVVLAEMAALVPQGGNEDVRSAAVDPARSSICNELHNMSKRLPEIVGFKAARLMCHRQD